MLVALLPFLQFLFQLVPLFLYLLLGLLGIVYFLHAHPDSASGPGDHAGQRDTGGHREYWRTFSSCSKPCGYFRDTRSTSPHSRTFTGWIVPLALELRVGGIDLLHPPLRILPCLRWQVRHLVGVVGARELPVGGADLLRRRPLRDPEGLPRRGEPGLPLQYHRGTTLLSPLLRRGAPGTLICPAVFFAMASLLPV